MSLSNIQVANPKCYVSPFNVNVPSEYDYILIDTTASSSPSTITLGNIYLLGYLGVNKKFIITDISNNASSSPITIYGSGGDTINNQASVVLNTNGGIIEIQAVGSGQWLATISGSGGGGGSGYNQIQDEGTNLTQRTTLNFVGAGVSATDNGSETVVTIAGGGGGAIVDITYTDFYTDITNGDLVAGTTYRITDYQSSNFLNGYALATALPTPVDPNFNPTEVYTSPNIEVLQVKAISGYEIEPIAVSESFPSDIIYYNPYINSCNVRAIVPSGSTELQWDGTNVYFDFIGGIPVLLGEYININCTFNSGADDLNDEFSEVLPTVANVPTTTNGTLTSNITIDLANSRVILDDLTLTDFNNYDTGSLNFAQAFGYGSATGVITRRTDTVRNISFPCDFRNRVYRRFQINLTGFGNTLDYWGVGDSFLGQSTTGLYQDLPMLSLTDFYENIIVGGAYATSDNVQSGDNLIFAGYCFNFNFGYKCYDSTFKGGNDNLIGNYFYNNAVASGFVNNTISSNFYVNSIASSFQRNTIKNQFSNNFI